TPQPPPPKPKPEPKPEPKTEPKPDAGTPPKPQAAAPPHTNAPPALTERARLFFAALLPGEPGPLVNRAEAPFVLGDKRPATLDQLTAEWLNQLRSKRPDLLAFKGFEVLTPAEMEQRFGKPPPRLSSWPISSGKTYLVVANLSGRAAVALYHQEG